MSSDMFVLDSRAHTTVPPARPLAVRLAAATVAGWTGSCQVPERCNPDLAAELVYVPAILARSSA
jgi:hypothetical protein